MEVARAVTGIALLIESFRPVQHVEGAGGGGVRPGGRASLTPFAGHPVDVSYDGLTPVPVRPTPTIAPASDAPHRDLPGALRPNSRPSDDHPGYAAVVLQSSSIIAFVSATDLERARRFYEHTLGLRFVEQGQFGCVFDANGTMLRITATAEVSSSGYTVLGWRVADIQQAIEVLVANGVTFSRYDGMDQDANGVWTAPGGDKVAWFSDPDGNNLSLTQFAQTLASN
jgi:catechol 2,3-dioxygenase-like lactoylglutathione lyase family enzyme